MLSPPWVDFPAPSPPCRGHPGRSPPACGGLHALRAWLSAPPKGAAPLRAPPLGFCLLKKGGSSPAFPISKGRPGLLDPAQNPGGSGAKPPLPRFVKNPGLRRSPPACGGLHALRAWLSAPPKGAAPLRAPPLGFCLLKKGGSSPAFPISKGRPGLLDPAQNPGGSGAKPPLPRFVKNPGLRRSPPACGGLHALRAWLSAPPKGAAPLRAPPLGFCLSQRAAFHILGRPIKSRAGAEDHSDPAIRFSFMPAAPSFHPAG